MRILDFDLETGVVGRPLELLTSAVARSLAGENGVCGAASLSFGSVSLICGTASAIMTDAGSHVESKTKENAK